MFVRRLAVVHANASAAHPCAAPVRSACIIRIPPGAFALGDDRRRRAKRVVGGSLTARVNAPAWRGGGAPGAAAALALTFAPATGAPVIAAKAVTLRR